MSFTPIVLRPASRMSFTGDADHLAADGDEHDFVGVAHGERADHAAGLVAGLHGDDALAAARLDAVLVEVRALADAVLAGDQQRGVRLDDARRRRRASAFSSSMPLHATRRCGPSSGRRSSLKRMLMPSCGDEHDVVVVVAVLPRVSLTSIKVVARFDADGDDAALADVLRNRSSAVVFTVPCRVTKNSSPGCCQVRSSLLASVLGRSRG
jgi:hypothetical protein